MISKAVRNIYLVRHGQYEIGETEPQKRILTGFYFVNGFCTYREDFFTFLYILHSYTFDAEFCSFLYNFIHFV